MITWSHILTTKGGKFQIEEGKSVKKQGGMLKQMGFKDKRRVVLPGGKRLIPLIS
jgi:hypothetical protein